MTEARHRGELIERLREAVESHLEADVPLGAFLSGGVDSSAVVAMMAGLTEGAGEHLLDRLRRPGLRRIPYARQVARALQDHHQCETVDKDDYGLVDTLAHLYDEPYADSSAIPTYRVCQLARKRVTVALSGDGGDENFAGYRRYRYAMAEHRVRSMLPLACASRCSASSGKPIRRPTGRRACSAPRPPSRRWRATWSRATSTACRSCRPRARQLFSDSFRSRLQGYRAVEVMRRHAPMRRPTIRCR
jgi:asparagine synthase (glutamine-hydrolysing)